VSRAAARRKPEAETGPTQEGKNGGTLLVGNPGNAGGPGVPPSAIRLLCRKSFAERLPILERIADGLLTQEIATRDGPVTVGPTLRDRVQAIGMIGKYGGIEKVTVEAAPAQQVESGEAAFARVVAIMPRVIVFAPSDERARMLKQLRAKEEIVVEPKKANRKEPD
jgi:hypothetical protein